VTGKKRKAARAHQKTRRALRRCAARRWKTAFILLLIWPHVLALAALGASVLFAFGWPSPNPVRRWLAPFTVSVFFMAEFISAAMKLARARQAYNRISRR
jgi:hypothetical protein